MPPAPFGGLNPSGTVMCSRCGRIIVYDASTSWWLDDTGVPGCAPDDDGNVLQHDPVDSPEAIQDDRDWNAGQ